MVGAFSIHTTNAYALTNHDILELWTFWYSSHPFLFANCQILRPNLKLLTSRKWRIWKSPLVGFVSHLVQLTAFDCWSISRKGSSFCGTSTRGNDHSDTTGLNITILFIFSFFPCWSCRCLKPTHCNADCMSSSSRRSTHAVLYQRISVKVTVSHWFSVLFHLQELRFVFFELVFELEMVSSIFLLQWYTLLFGSLETLHYIPIWFRDHNWKVCWSWSYCRSTLVLTTWMVRQHARIFITVKKAVHDKNKLVD